MKHLITDASLTSALRNQGVSRRHFLEMLGGIVAIAETHLGAHGAMATTSNTGLRFDLFRDEDLLSVRISSDGLEFVKGGLWRCDRIKPLRKASETLVTISFPPQHLLEQSVPEDSSGSDLPRRGTLRALRSNATDLVFRWPHALESLDFSTEELLRIFGFECVFASSHIEPVSGIALTPANPSSCRWAISSRKLGGPSNPLFSARLQTQVPPLQMWAPRWHTMPATFPTPLTDTDRNNIVDTFSGQTPSCSVNAVVLAPEVGLLALSSQGAWLDLKAGWDPVPGCGLAEWVENVSHGRDHYVEAVYKFWAYPDGLPFLVAKQTTREFDRCDDDRAGGVGAYLKTRLLQRATKQSQLVSPEDLFEQPFTEFILPTDDSPVLDIDTIRGDRPAASGNYVIGDINEAQLDLGAIAFWPLHSGSTVLNRTLVRDYNGEPKEIQRSFLLVGNALMHETSSGEVRLRNPQHEKLLDDAWEASPSRNVSMGGRKWAVAKTASPGDTSVTLESMDIVRAAPRGSSRPFYARAHRLNAVLDVSRHLAGETLSIPLTFRPRYLSSPTAARSEPDLLLDPDSADGGAFVRVHAADSASLEIGKGAEQQLGALSTPGVMIAGVGRDRGLLLGSPDLPPTPGIQSIFPAASKLLGAFSFADILDANTTLPEWQFASDDETQQALLSSSGDEEPRLDGWMASLAWKCDSLQSNGFFGAGSSTALGLLARVGCARSTGISYWQSEGKLVNFTIGFPSAQAPWLNVVFDELTFAASNTNEPTFSCRVARVEFDGLLKLLEALRDALHLPPGLNVTVSKDAIGVSYELRKDDPIDVIGLTIGKIAITTSLLLPLDGRPLEIGFDLNTKDKPFSITSASGYAGGGYVGIRANSSGIGSFAIAFEIGAMASKSFGGIAQGEVSLMAGLYFRSASSDFMFEGYVRLHGCLSVARIGGVNIMAYLGLTWRSSAPKEFAGRCEVRVTVWVGPIEVSQGFEATHTFSAGGSQSLLEEPVGTLAGLVAFCEGCP